MGVPYEVERELRYELGMADFAHERLTAWGEGSDTEIALGVQMALLESFLAHVRLVDEFLGGRERTRPDDIVAGQYVEGWQGRGFLSDADRKRTDRQLLHLTEARRVGREHWPIHIIARGLGDTFLEFIGALPEADRAGMAATEEHARRLVVRSSSGRMREINLGFVWAEDA